MRMKQIMLGEVGVLGQDSSSCTLQLLVSLNSFIRHNGGAVVAGSAMSFCHAEPGHFWEPLYTLYGLS